MFRGFKYDREAGALVAAPVAPKVVARIVAHARGAAALRAARAEPMPNIIAFNEMN